MASSNGTSVGVAGAAPAGRTLMKTSPSWWRRRGRGLGGVADGPLGGRGRQGTRRQDVDEDVAVLVEQSVRPHGEHVAPRRVEAGVVAVVVAEAAAVLVGVVRRIRRHGAQRP